MTGHIAALDHLLIGARTLDAGIDWLEDKTGVRAVIGGSHPGLGTWNALASLGAGQYIELIAPDPTQPGIPTFYVPRLRDFITPRIATWAARGTDLRGAFVEGLPSSLSCAAPREGSRVRPDGVQLAWTLAFPKHREHGAFGGALPFLIEWESPTAHPSLTTPPGMTLVSLEISHPESASLADSLSAIGIAADVSEGPTAGLRAVLDTPKGRVVL